MGFDRNPHVTKAQAAEEKARNARDDAARALARREAANFWERAATRERDPKRQREYQSRAESMRALADEGAAEEGAAGTASDEAATAPKLRLVH